MYLIKCFIIGCISACIILIVLLFNKININTSHEQQAVIDMIYNSNK